MSTTIEEKTAHIVLEPEKLKDDEIKDNYRIVYILFALIGATHFLPATFFATANDPPFSGHVCSPPLPLLLFWLVTEMSTTMEEKTAHIVLEPEKLKDDEIKDNYRIVYILFALIGATHFLPATFFATANDYWMYKFRNTSFEEADSDYRTTLEVDFSPSVLISTHVATVSFSFLTLFYGHRISHRLRLYGSLISILVLYIIAAIFINVNTDTWQVPFFVITMLTIAGINGMGAVFGLTFFSVLAKFPKIYLEPYLNGQGVAGILTALLQVLALAVGVSTTKSAMVYFWIAIGLIVVCLASLWYIEKHNNLFKHYNSKQIEKLENRKTMSVREFVDTFLKIWKSQGVLLFFLWTISPTHPSITSLVVSEWKGSGKWSDVYFIPVTVFVVYSCGEFIGRIVPMKYRSLQKLNGIWYVAFSAARVAIFVPLVMLSNAQPRNHLPVAFPHDYQFLVIMIALSLGSGFLLSIGNLMVPHMVPPEKLEDAYRVNLAAAGIQMGTFSFLGFVSVDLL